MSGTKGGPGLSCPGFMTPKAVRERAANRWAWALVSEAAIAPATKAIDTNVFIIAISFFPV